MNELLMEKFGAPDDKIEETLKGIREKDFTPGLVSELERYAGSIVIGAIFSALIGLFVNRPDDRPIIKAVTNTE